MDHIGETLSLIHQNYFSAPHHIDEGVTPPAGARPVNVCRLQNYHFNCVLVLQHLCFDLNFGVGIAIVSGWARRVFIYPLAIRDSVDRDWAQVHEATHPGSDRGIHQVSTGHNIQLRIGAVRLRAMNNRLASFQVAVKWLRVPQVACPQVDLDT
jgi:hypothetical protein